MTVSFTRSLSSEVTDAVYRVAEHPLRLLKFRKERESVEYVTTSLCHGSVDNSGKNISIDPWVLQRKGPITNHPMRLPD
jgi:hypothetical protein